MAGTELELPTYEQIATILSQLMTNYNAIIENFYNLFYNPEPQDIVIDLYTADGTLRSYTIPNRAKDNRYILNGKGTPEGIEVAPIGAIYQDTEEGVLYIKQTGTDKTGWTKVGGDVYIEGGSGSPEGILARTKGSLYVDKSNADLYIKSTGSGKNGWILISSKDVIIDYSGV